MSELSSQDYWKEVQDLARNMLSETWEWIEDKADYDRDELIEETLERVNDTVLHETVDGHQWVIYYSYNLDVIKHSNNEDYYNDNFGAESLAHSLSEGGLDTLHCHIAFWCLYADIQDMIGTVQDEVFEELMPETE